MSVVHDAIREGGINGHVYDGRVFGTEHVDRYVLMKGISFLCCGLLSKSS